MSSEMLQTITIENRCIQKDKVYVSPAIYAMSERKIEQLKKIAYIQKYYQCNPVRFIKDFFNIELLDVQAIIVQRGWICPNVMVLASRGMGKSTVIDLLIMAKQMLFNNYWSYICSSSGSQSQQTFITLERLCNDNIDEMIGSTGYIFKAEVEVKQAAGDGFSHSSDGFQYSTYNGGTTKTLNSNVDSHRGARGNVVFDEASFVTEELLAVYAAFAAVNKSFKTGTDRDGNTLDPIRLRTIPITPPYQKFYISSASSTDTKYYKLYRDFAKRMIAGDPDYFVIQIDCELLFQPTLHGKVISPLLEKSMVTSEMATNPEKARREYYCQFTTDAGLGAIIRRGVIARNEEIRKPLLYNDTGDKKFVIAYDPARSKDNSVILVGEIYDYDLGGGNIEKRMRLVNCINLADVGKKKRTPMQTPDQIRYLKNIILDYNQGGDDTYSNIIAVMIDAGSGGGGVNIADYLMEDWKDDAGNMHRGLIDKEYSAEYIKKFPNAVDKIKLMSPSQYKSEMFEALIELSNQNKISYTASYDNKGYLTIFDLDQKAVNKIRNELDKSLVNGEITEEDYETKLAERIGKLDVSTRVEKLSWQEEIALTGIDALKEELVNMVRIKRESRHDSFEICAEKRGNLNDDRAYTCAMAAYALMQERRKEFTNRKRAPRTDLVERLPIKKGRRSSMFSK